MNIYQVLAMTVAERYDPVRYFGHIYLIKGVTHEAALLAGQEAGIEELRIAETIVVQQYLEDVIAGAGSYLYGYGSQAHSKEELDNFLEQCLLGTNPEKDTFNTYTWGLKGFAKVVKHPCRTIASTWAEPYYLVVWVKGKENPVHMRSWGLSPADSWDYARQFLSRPEEEYEHVISIKKGRWVTRPGILDTVSSWGSDYRSALKALSQHSAHLIK